MAADFGLLMPTAGVKVAPTAIAGPRIAPSVTRLSSPGRQPPLLSGGNIARAVALGHVFFRDAGLTIPQFFLEWTALSGIG